MLKQKIINSARVTPPLIQKPIRYIGSAESLLKKLELLDKLFKKKD